MALAFSVPKLPGFLSFRKELLPCPPFPDAAAPLSQMESNSQKGAKWNRLCPKRGVMGTPTKHSFCPVHVATHTLPP